MNSKIVNPHRLLFNLQNKINLERSDKCVALLNLSIYYARKNSYKNNKIKISAPTWNEELEFPDGLYFVIYQIF